MRISLTGTFSVPRKELEEKISGLGHEIVDFSGKTEIFLVGEKTASPKKIAKAETMGIKVIRESDTDRALEALGGSVTNDTYITYYDRLDEDENPSAIDVGLNEAPAVLDDYISVNADAGEWFPEDDGKRDMISLTGGDGKNIEAAAGIENFLKELGITIREAEKNLFFTVFYRLIFLRILCQEIESEVGPYCEPKDNISSKEVSREDFYENIADFISFEEPEAVEKFRKNDDLKKLILETKEDEKGIGTVKPPAKLQKSPEKNLALIFELFNKELRKITDLVKAEALSPEWRKNIDLIKEVYSHEKLRIQRGWDYSVQINGVDNYITSVKYGDLMNNLGIVEEFLKAEIKIFDCSESFPDSMSVAETWKKINPPKRIVPMEIPGVKDLWEEIKEAKK